MHPGELWQGRGAWARLCRLALAPASFLYALGWEAYLLVYRLGLKRAAAPHHPIVCVGNIRVGGSGKTPIVLHLAGLIQDLGRKVVVSASGYGSPRSESASLAPAGELSPKEWGDEPAMIRWHMPQVPLIVGRDRVEAAAICHREFPEAVLLLDDGFQHLRLKKDLAIVLEAPAEGSTMCLPAGPYREPRRSLRRADLVIPGAFRIEGGLTGFQTSVGEFVSLEDAKGREVNLLCALGTPRRFLEALLAAGIRVRRYEFLPDHDPLTRGILLSRFEADLPIAAAAKDWVKLRERDDLADRKFWIAEYELHIEPAGAFRSWLGESLQKQ